VTTIITCHGTWTKKVDTKSERTGFTKRTSGTREIDCYIACRYRRAQGASQTARGWLIDRPVHRRSLMAAA